MSLSTSEQSDLITEEFIDQFNARTSFLTPTTQDIQTAEAVDAVVYDDLFENSYSFEIRQFGLKELIKLYQIDPLSFYGECKKQQKSVGTPDEYMFDYQIGDLKISAVFQSENYDQTMKMYIQAINSMKKMLKIQTKQLRNLKLNDAYENNKKNLDLILTEGLEDGEFVNFGGCYWCYEQRIELVYNEKTKKRIQKTINYYFHEYAHFMYENYMINQSHYVKPFAKKDHKVGYLFAKELKYLPRKKYNEYFCTPVGLKSLTKTNVCESDYYEELFVEIFSDLIVMNQKGRIHKKVIKKDLLVSDMYPHTRYVVEKLLQGKRPNRFKQFKKPTISKIKK